VTQACGAPATIARRSPALAIRDESERGKRLTKTQVTWYALGIRVHHENFKSFFKAINSLVSVHIQFRYLYGITNDQMQQNI
jgi:hypothetical protein